MKENLFEILLSLVEKTLLQLKEQYEHITESTNKSAGMVLSSSLERKENVQMHFIQSAREDSIRVITQEEQNKLTKSSLQLLVRMVDCGVLHSGLFELIMNRLLLSESRIVSLQETKWVIRNTLSENLSLEQLSFLDLILYHQEDATLLH